MKASMSLDDRVLLLQRWLDRLVRRCRLGRAPASGRRRLLVVQIDGLSRAVLERALAEGRMPFLRRLLQRGGGRLHPMSVGLPTSTPAFQMAAMYGVSPDIPGFHYHDKRRRTDVYFPRAGDAAHIEATQAAGRRGIVAGGSTYGCVFTGGADNSLLTFAMLKRPSGAGLLRALSAVVVLAWVVVKSLAIYVNYLDYDIFAHAWGPRHGRAMRSLRAVDASLRQLWRVARRVPEHRYDIYLLADHGQAHCTPYDQLTGGRRIERLLFEDFLTPAGAHEVAPGRPGGHRLASGIKAIRSGREPGVVQ